MQTKIDMELGVKRRASRLLALNERLAELSSIRDDARALYQRSQEELSALEVRIAPYTLYRKP